MAHPRELIRKQAVAVLLGATNAGASVYANVSSMKQLLTLPLLALLLTACAGRPTTLLLDSQPVKPAAIPVLPPQARQLPAPPLCLPTCSSALTNERATWLKLLTKPEPGE